jgi:hypothetical protein
MTHRSAIASHKRRQFCRRNLAPVHRLQRIKARSQCTRVKLAAATNQHSIAKESAIQQRHDGERIGVASIATTNVHITVDVKNIAYASKSTIQTLKNSGSTTD